MIHSIQRKFYQGVSAVRVLNTSNTSVGMNAGYCHRLAESEFSLCLGLYWSLINPQDLSDYCWVVHIRVPLLLGGWAEDREQSL